MIKQTTKKEIEGKMLTGLNNFMHKYGVEEISFGKRHSLKKAKSGKAIPVIKTKNND